MPSQLQLVNRCLAELGRLPVQSINDSPDALYVANKIDELFPEVLLEANWTWAIKYREDDTPLTVSITPDYIYTYVLPGDFGRFYRFASTGAQWPIYEFIDNYLCAQTKPVQYYYIVNQASYQDLLPMFSRALVLYAAAMSAPTLTNNVQLTSYLQKMYQLYLGKAILENDMRRSVTSTPYSDFDRLTYV